MGAEQSRRYRPPAADVAVNLPSSVPNTDLVRRKKPRQMDRLRRTLSFRSKKKDSLSDNNTNQSKQTGDNLPSTENKPLQWQDDDKSVRVGSCNFNVKYLGSVEVHESRGMHVCEQAIQALLNQKAKHIKAVLYISGDALRVVDETNKGLIVDQTIEKVSFCAPDRQHEKGFAYICRDGTTRRWLCHTFLAIKDTGERLSHAVGCAFQICLERKQKRDRECGVTVEYTQNGSSFTRFGSFRTTTTTITEGITNPQGAIITEPSSHNASNQKHVGIERPRPKGAVKRQSSLRPSDLPSIQEAKHKDSLTNTISEEVESTSTINELSKLSLNDSTNTNGRGRLSLPTIKRLVIPSSSSTTNNENITSNFWLTNPQSIISEQSERTPSINDAFNSNLSALVQSNHAANPFSPYGVSMPSQGQLPTTNQRQSTIFTPKRGTNPFDDDLIRR